MSVKQDLVGNPGNQSNAWLAYHVTFHCESVDFFSSDPCLVVVDKTVFEAKINSSIDKA